MFANLPSDWNEFSTWGWDRISPFADHLLQTELGAESLGDWLTDWSRLARLIAETFNRLRIRTTTHTSDEEGMRGFREYSEQVMPNARAFEQAMKTKLLESGLEAEGFEIPLQRMRSDAAIFREENLGLRTEIERLETEFQALAGARTFDWDGQRLDQAELTARLAWPDRRSRERAWRALSECIANQRAAIDEIWVQLLDLRDRMARNAGFGDYRSYRWKELGRFHYSPEDCRIFHTAIQEVVVPAVNRLAEKRRRNFGIDKLRAWDDHWWERPDSEGRPPLEPFASIGQLNKTIEHVLSGVHPMFAEYYRIMEDEKLLDLEARSGKAQGGYMEELPASKRAFIFMTAVGSARDVIAQLHESGHACHVFESARWPYHYQSMLEFMPVEFIELASMAMELLATPYLGSDRGGFYTPPQLVQARSEHLMAILEFWPYMAAVDAFQHWVYENPQAARDPDQCDEAWAKLHRAFLPHLDWTDLEDTLRLSWRLQTHILLFPFYYVEYGMAQLGAVQLWANALENQEQAVRAYRSALAIGNTASLPDLYRAAGVRFDFGRDTLARAVGLIEKTLDAAEDAR
jgi:oligoendopeptidase F